jgi:hypothetical protein
MHPVLVDEQTFPVGSLQFDLLFRPVAAHGVAGTQFHSAPGANRSAGNPLLGGEGACQLLFVVLAGIQVSYPPTSGQDSGQGSLLGSPADLLGVFTEALQPQTVGPQVALHTGFVVQRQSATKNEAVKS